MEPLDTIGVSLKAKYVKRTGSPGKYKYWYRNPATGKLQAGKQTPSKKPKESEAKKVEKFKKEVEIKKHALIDEYDYIDDELRDKMNDAYHEAASLGEDRADLYHKLHEKQKGKTEKQKAELQSDYNFEDGKLEEKEEDARDKATTYSQERDELYDTYRKKMDEIEDIEKGGKKIFENTGELGGAMEKLEELGASGEILYG